MAKEKQFLEKFMRNEKFMTMIGSASDEEVVEIAKKAGYDIDPAELEKQLTEMREAMSTEIEEIDDGELDQAAGGRMFCGDTAPSGHEMGCILSYHGFDTCKARDWKCQKNFYCLEEHADLYIQQYGLCEGYFYCVQDIMRDFEMGLFD
ncbi:MAG: Nif11-like leader peptide family RiPP precursor [Lachnospiraceae bacterium]|nr:Nif11-like leader peptide family RiPP precursor [Lachnospiraceae bacterium]